MDNKVLLKIAGVIALVLGILECLTIFGIIIGIPTIIGGIKLKNLADADDYVIEQEKDNILIWAIVFLFICKLSGALALIYYIGYTDSHKDKTKESKVVNEKKNN